MALMLKPKGAPAAPAAAPSPAPQAKAPASKPAAPKPASGGKGGSLLKRGKAAQETFAQEEHKAEARKKNDVFRFWIPQDKEASITFLDGDLTPEGILDIPFFYEHNVNMNGKWGNFFVCTQDEEPCPICEGGGNPTYVGLLTIIDHSEYVSKKDGQTKKDNVKLMVVKRDTVKLLQKYAVKRGGLRGCRFDASRTGDKSPSVGNSFDFVSKLTEEQLVKTYGEKSKPINYEELLSGMYIPAADLRKLGFGSPHGPVGAEAPMQEDFQGEM